MVDLDVAFVVAWPFVASGSDPNYDEFGRARIGFAACLPILRGIADPVGNSPRSTERGWASFG